MLDNTANSQESVLDALDLPLLLVSDEGVPLFLSAAGARLLALRDRSRLSEQCTALQPLLDLARTPPRSFLFDEPALVPITLMRLGGVSFPVLASVRQLRWKDTTSAFAVVFISAQGFEPVMHSFRLLTRGRLLAVLGAAAFEAELRLASARPLADAIGALERKQSSSAELAQTLTAALRISDQFTLPTVKITTAVDTSALLALDREALLRILLHLLFEAVDFSSPSGGVRLQTVLDGAGESNAARLELVVLAERDEGFARPLSALERYLLSQVMPSHYGVSVLRADQFAAEQTTVQPENYSDNMRAAMIFSSSRGVGIHLRRLRRELLAIHAVFPLVTERQGG